MKYQNKFVYELDERVVQDEKASVWRTILCSSPKKALEIAIAWRTEMEANEYHDYDVNYRMQAVYLDRTEGSRPDWGVILEGVEWVSWKPPILAKT